MADDDSSEEKQFKATARKLRQAREKGQAASSADLVSAIGFIAAMVMVFVLGQSLAAACINLFSFAVTPSAIPPQTRLTTALMAMGWGLFSPLAQIVGVTSLAILMTHVAHKGGLIFSGEPLKPDFKKLNPGAGFKRMFTEMRSWVELGVSLLRCLIWFAASYVLVRYYLPSLIKAPLCGMGCSLSLGRSSLTWLGSMAAVFLIAVGLMDVPMQVMLFMRQMRMSRTELKKDLRESEGSPEMLRHRKEMSMAAANMKGLTQASFIVGGPDVAVAIFYHPEEAPVPKVIAKGRAIAARRILETARKYNIPVDPASDLAERLYDTSLDFFVPEKEFPPIAMIIVRLQNEKRY